MSTIVYIDGFNLYYRAIRDTPYKWLDVVALSRHVLADNDVTHVRYFTANIIATPDDPQASQRQQIYLRALATLPDLTIHYGQFKRRHKRGPLVTPKIAGVTMATIATFEEKGSDVNIAAYALADA